MPGLRQKVENEIRSIVTEGCTPLYGLASMNAYHLGFADRKGRLLEASKGKYMRPLFCLAVCAGLCGSPEEALPAAASLELVHRTSLIFDDIQDVGKERNGQPAMWTIWGANQAINAGLALSCYSRLAAQRLSILGHSSAITLKVLNVLENAVIDLCRGQYLDLSFMETLNVTQDDYMRMVQGKTGALFGAACETGAICAGVNQTKVDLAREFGINMGIAFQIIDDYLGIWGDEVQTGKTANDLIEKKRSLPVVMALEWYPLDMTPWLNRSEIWPSVAGEIKSWMESKGIDNMTKTAATSYISRASELLQLINLSPEWQEIIDQFLSSAFERQK